MGSKAEIDQVIELGIHLENDVAAVTAVPSVGSALGDKLFPKETDGATTAVASVGMDTNSINEHEKPPTIGRFGEQEGWRERSRG